MARRARATSASGRTRSVTRVKRNFFARAACDRAPRCGRSASMSNPEWSIEKSSQLYNIPGWGAGYFNINQKGHMVVHPFGQPGPMIDLMDVVDDIRERKLGFPCIVRFQDVLRSRVKQLNDVFRAAIAQHSYKGQYFGVYPTKVNQMREVVEEILDAGAPYHFGLEAGSKGELLIVLALNTDPEALTICNGYKDEEYLRLALLGRKLGRKTLGVDYVGARSTAFVSSLNYSMEEYAADVVDTVQQICTNEGVPEPHLVSESGRALTAHHSCLLMNVFGHIEFGENGAVQEEAPITEHASAPVPAEAPTEAPIVREMREII